MTNRELKALCREERDEELKQIDAMTEKKTGQVRVISASENEGGKRRSWGTRRKIVAAVIVLTILAAGVIFGPRVYAQVQAWIKVQRGEWGAIQVISVHPEAEFANYRLGWKPDRFEHKMAIEEEEYRFSEEYDNEHLIDIPMDEWESIVNGRFDRTDLFPERGKVWASPELDERSFFGWGYYKISKAEEAVMYVDRVDPETGESWITEEGSWQIRGWEVLYYQYYMYGASTHGTSDQDKTTERYRYDMICCIWIDQEHDVAFRMDGTLTKEEAQKIIENVKLVK